jgi:hypothetical protein
MYKYVLYIILGLIFCISCRTSKKIQPQIASIVLEKSGILVSYNKESNWFIPLKEYNENKDIESNLEKENIDIGFYLDYTHDNELFRFINELKIHKNIFITNDSNRRELIPIRIKYKKLERASDISCETELLDNSFYYYDQLIEYKINTCVYISVSITQLAINQDLK